MRLSAVIVCSFGFFVLAQPARAIMMEHEIDPEHSAIVFKVMHQGISYVWGRFDGISGTVKVDSFSSPKEIEFYVEVNAGSIDTNNKKRDRELAKKDFLDTSKHRKITFESKSSKRVEEGVLEVTGDLTLLGKTKPLTVTFRVLGSAKESDFKNRIGGEATFTIKRSDFGMTNMLDSIGDEVTLMVSIEAVSKVRPAG